MSISDEWFYAVNWSSVLFGIFMIKKGVEFTVTSFGNLKCDCIIRTTEMFNFLPLINSSVTTEF